MQLNSRQKTYLQSAPIPSITSRNWWPPRTLLIVWNNTEADCDGRVILINAHTASAILTPVRFFSKAPLSLRLGYETRCGS